MPPEWAPHDATWLSWPHNRDTWPEDLEAAQDALGEAAAALAAGEMVHINVTDEGGVRGRFGRLIDSGRVVLHAIPTNDAWCRDYGAIIVRDETGRRVALDFRFNAWGGKYPFDLDDAVPPRMAQALGLPCVAVDAVLEGGSIDLNGSGRLLTTEQCLLNPNRNPSMSRKDIEGMLGRYLGIREVIWLGEGIAGDDTDGHVDDFARFVAEDTVVCAVEPDRSDVNHEPLHANAERLKSHGLRVVELPMPRPLYRGAGRLPASYANFYIGNEVVLVPAFGCPRDADAAVIFGACFPGRSVVPIDSRALVAGLGALHCLTQQVPA
jgi:agmatine deiminase